MLHVVLHQPEIPPNTGNIIRLCANTGARLHLIEPLGFELEDRRLRRAGLDYHEWASVLIHPDLESCRAHLPGRVFALTTRARRSLYATAFREGDALLFGQETRGLPDALLKSLAEEQRLRLPMLPRSRSLNLSNAVTASLYEAWRQLGFSGAVDVG